MFSFMICKEGYSLSAKINTLTFTLRHKSNANTYAP